MNVPFLSERSFDVSLLELIFGVIIVSYFGHLSAGNCAKVVLRRDPSARSLIWGIVTAQIFAIVLYCLWVVAVNGALAPDVLAGQSGTPLASLAAVAGPIVLLLGSVFTVLGMGMGSIHLTMGLFNLVGERLPSRSHPILLLMRYRDSLFFERRKKSNDDLHLGMVYLGLQQGKPQFRFDVQFEGKMYRCEAAANENLDAMTVLSQVVPSRISGIDLRLEVLKASEESVSLRVDSSLMIRYEGSWNAGGLHLADALTLPASQRQLLQWMLRQGKVSLPQVVAHLGQDLKTAQIQLDVLMEQGLLREVRDGNEIRYQTHLAAKQGRPLPEHIWRALDKEEKTPARRPEVTKPGANTWRHTVWERMLSERGRFVLSISPVMVAFAMTEWLFFMGAESFSETLSFAGLITASLFSGIFSVLLLVSSRRKGDFIPKMFFQFLGHPVLVISIYILFLVNFFLHGLIIWQNPVQRASALLVGLLALGATIMMIRRGAFAARTVIELRVSSSTADDRAILTSVTGDQQAIVEAALEYPEGKRQVRGAMVDIPSFTKLRSIILPLSNRQARELKVWVHKLTPEGNSESLPAKIEVQCADESKQYDLKLTGEHVQLPLGRDPCQVKIILTQERTP
ncbi:hypothetical protein HYR54_01460 [Candidatus Acetothermia bacterium]|nr:hypothetical protein [Candidatus Acetothermia bacterium]